MTYLLLHKHNLNMVMGLLTTQETARRFRLSAQRIRQMIAARTLPAIQLGHTYGISAGDLTILRRRKRKPGPARGPRRPKK